MSNDADTREGGCPRPEELLLFSDGELTGDREGFVARHVASCAACAAELSLLSRAGEALAAARGSEPAAGGAACPSPGELAGYADGTLEGAAAGRVETHIARCGSCLREVADLWRLGAGTAEDAGGAAPPDGAGGTERAVAAVLRRLERDSRTAVVRWSERVCEVVRDFVSAGGAAPDWGPTPAFSAARAGAPQASLRWYGERGAELAVLVSADTGGPSITGRLTFSGRPAAAVSVRLSSAAGRRGPESLDPAGRFGPWALGPGANTLVLTGPAAWGSDGLTFVVELEESGDGGSDGRGGSGGAHETRGSGSSGEGDA